MNFLKSRVKAIINWSLYGKISRKISTVFLFFIIGSVTLSYALYQYSAANYTLSNLNRSTNQTLVSISQNISDMVTSADNNYALLLKTDITALVSDDLTADKLRFYDTYLFTIVDTYAQINSIYITDFSNHLYGIDKAEKKSLRVDSIKEAPWYDEVMDAHGGYVLWYNAGNIFNQYYSSDFISMIRVINNLETQKPMGIAILNISCDSISSMFHTVFPTRDVNVGLYTADNTLVTHSGNIINSAASDSVIGKVSKERPYYSVTEKDNLIAALYMEDLDYTLVVSLPINYKIDFSNPLFGNWALVLLINIILMFLCSVSLSKSIANPIHNLIHSMRGVKHENFTPVEVLYPDSEIGMLEDNYNHMILEIQSLLKRLVKEQKLKRKIELCVLQEQIKPHFLYNTLDAIGYMALTEEPTAVYGAIETLGSFYRQSLSKGGQIISLKEEVQIVRDYVALLTLRYESLFEVAYEIDETLLSLQVPKLMLQPLIENSIYHGIKPLGEQGYITLRITSDNDFVLLSVTDNGIGMDTVTIHNITDSSADTKEKAPGIGLVGTLERLNIFYGDCFHYKIESEKNRGTKITLYLPLSPMLSKRKEP